MVLSLRKFEGNKNAVSKEFQRSFNRSAVAIVNSTKMFALKTVASGLAICFVQQVAQDDASLRIVNVQATSRQLVTRGADVLETCEACAVNKNLQQQH